MGRRFCVIRHQGHDNVTSLNGYSAEGNAMIKPIDVKTELATLPFLHGRGPHTTDTEKRASFTTLAPYRDDGICGFHPVVWACHNA